MSGVFLIVWERNLILQTTSGGYPHVTMFYSGDSINVPHLMLYAERAFSMTVMHDIELSSARIDPVETKRGLKYYVLLDITDTTLLDSVQAFLMSTIPEEMEGKVFARKPHVTYKICDTREEANDCFIDISQSLPLKARITGVTID